jgi:uncharacterized membrane protein YkoI
MGAFAFDEVDLIDLDRLGDFENDDADDAVERPDTPITGEALEQASQAALDHMGEGRVTDTEVGDEEGYYEVEITLEDGQQVDVHLNANFEVLGEIEDVEEAEEEEAAAEDEAEGEDTPISDEGALDQAGAAALEYLGEGRVTDTEVGDEEGFYEIEVTLDNGREVDVHLDENFNVLGHEAE